MTAPHIQKWLADGEFSEGVRVDSLKRATRNLPKVDGALRPLLEFSALS